MVTICCVCHRVHKGNEWVEEPVPGGELPSHGYCPDCADQARIGLLLSQLKNIDLFCRRFPRVAADGAAA